jgi:putative hydrolase of the HAD superfamily
VLFDLGGVVCQFFHGRRLAALAHLSQLTPEEVHRRIFASGFDLECDRGRYTLEQVLEELQARLGTRASVEQLVDCWAGAFVPAPEVLNLVDQVRTRAATGILTNNGPLVDVMLRQRFPDVLAHFDHPRFSYQARATKPDARAYRGTLDALRASAEQTLFIDDNEENVRGARAVGIDAIQFTDVQALRSALEMRKLL